LVVTFVLGTLTGVKLPPVLVYSDSKCCRFYRTMRMHRADYAVARCLSRLKCDATSRKTAY